MAAGAWSRGDKVDVDSIERNKIAFHLYAMNADANGVETAAEQRFSRATPDYILIYTAAAAPKNSVEIAGSDLKRLTEADERWLLDCNLILLAEDARDREREILEDAAKKVAALERALEEQRKREET